MKRLSPRAWPVGVFCIYQSVVALCLLLLIWYFTFGAGHSIHFSWDTVLPVYVPVGGALGGCFVSLVGIAMHTIDWNSSRFGYWHILRPLLGMLSGSVSVLVLLFVLKGVAPNVVPATDTPFTSSGIAVLFVLSFIVGYREETFRDLVRRVVDVILGPGDVNANSKIVIVPERIALSGKLNGADSPATAELTLFNATQDTLALKGSIVVHGLPDDRALTCAIVNEVTPLGPGEQRKLKISWDYLTYREQLTAQVTFNAGGYSFTSVVNGTLI